ncbi:MAG: NAD-dependent epimerase/dehydratase family protein [Bacteroidota bacterium]
MSIQNTDKKILVTGGTGFIGSYLLRYLIQKGHTNIFALKRPASTFELLDGQEEKIKWIDCDLLDILGLEDALEGIQQVYHSAGVVSLDPKKRNHMLQVNQEGTANLVNFSLHHGIEKFIHLSSIAALGRIRQGDTIDEKYKWERSKFNTHYAISKYGGEQEVWRGTAEGLNAVVINPSMVLGAGPLSGGTQVFFNFVNNSFKYFPTGANGFVDVRDVVRMMYQLMESEVSEERFIASAENFTYEQLMKSIAQKIDRPNPQTAIKAWVRNMAWRVEWLKSKFSGNPPRLTRESAMHSANSFYYKGDKSRTILNFEYTPISKTIEETCAAYVKARANDFKKVELLQF